MVSKYCKDCPAWKQLIMFHLGNGIGECGMEKSENFCKVVTHRHPMCEEAPKYAGAVGIPAQDETVTTKSYTVPATRLQKVKWFLCWWRCSRCGRKKYFQSTMVGGYWDCPDADCSWEGIQR